MTVSSLSAGADADDTGHHGESGRLKGVAVRLQFVAGSLNLFSPLHEARRIARMLNIGKRRRPKHLPIPLPNSVRCLLVYDASLVGDCAPELVLINEPIGRGLGR